MQTCLTKSQWWLTVSPGTRSSPRPGFKLLPSSTFPGDSSTARQVAEILHPSQPGFGPLPLRSAFPPIPPDPSPFPLQPNSPLHSPSSVVDDILDNPPDVPVPLSKVQRSEPGWVFSVVGMGLEDPSGFTLVADDSTHFCGEGRGDVSDCLWYWWGEVVRATVGNRWKSRDLGCLNLESLRSQPFLAFVSPPCLLSLLPKLLALVPPIPPSHPPISVDTHC